MVRTIPLDRVDDADGQYPPLHRDHVAAKIPTPWCQSHLIESIRLVPTGNHLFPLSRVELKDERRILLNHLGNFEPWGGNCLNEISFRGRPTERNDGLDG